MQVRNALPSFPTPIQAFPLQGAANTSSATWIIATVDQTDLKMVEVVFALKGCSAYAYAATAGSVLQ